jgi:hypothetical protein
MPAAAGPSPSDAQHGRMVTLRVAASLP